MRKNKGHLHSDGIEMPFYRDKKIGRLVDYAKCPIREEKIFRKKQLFFSQSSFSNPFQIPQSKLISQLD